jgi:cytochrome c
MFRWALIPTLLLVPACATAGDVAHGSAVAKAHCAPCHAIGFSGASPVSGALPFRDLHARFPVADLVGALAQGASTGHPRMPRFRLRTAEMLDLVAYVSSVQKPAHLDSLDPTRRPAP